MSALEKTSNKTDMQTSVNYTKKDQVAWVTMNRPEVLNALNEDLSKGLRAALHDAEFDPEVRCVVINSSSNNFMAGGDVGMFAGTLKQTPQQREAQFHEFIQGAHPIIESIARTPKPVVACLEGAVAGFGISLMAACDLAIAAENTFFTLSYTQIGLSPDGGSTFSLPRLIGLRRAMEVALLNDKIDAETAENYGLINSVVPGDTLHNVTEALAQKLANGPTQAYAQLKHLMRDSFETSFNQQLHNEQNSFAWCATTDDFKEGVSRFIQKKQPNFKGQ